MIYLSFGFVTLTKYFLSCIIQIVYDRVVYDEKKPSRRIGILRNIHF